jgi:hypothetical protein
MSIKARPVVADVLGCSAIVLLVLLWVVVPDPLKLYLPFPGGLHGIGFALLWVLVAPYLGGILGKEIVVCGGGLGGNYIRVRWFHLPDAVVVLRNASTRIKTARLAGLRLPIWRYIAISLTDP